VVGEEEICEVTVSNTGLGDLVYSVGVRLVGMLDASGEGKLGQGGPDEYGYFWLDTDEPGMAPPEWEDIRPIGTQVTLGDDNGVRSRPCRSSSRSTARRSHRSAYVPTGI